MRYFAGISVNTSGDRLEAALIGVHGEGAGAPLEVRQTLAFDLPAEITQMCGDLHNYQYALATHCGNPNVCADNVDVVLAHFLAHELASLENEAINELLAEAQLAPHDLLAVGIHDAGMRYYQSFGMGYHSLCHAARLASLSGQNVVDAFPTQDIAHGGDGKSTLAMPTWIMLREESKDRLLIDLGRTAKVAFLPKATRLRGHEQIIYRDVAPCGSLLDWLTSELTHGSSRIDAGGRETVQGCLIPELLAQWRGMEKQCIPYGLVGAMPTPYCEILKNPQSRAWSMRDILCTATHAISAAISAVVPELSSDGDILVSGGGCQHGMLLHQLSATLGGRQLTPLAQIGLAPDTFDAVCTAISTLMAVDQIPSNLPHISGAQIASSLGRFTAGSPTQWRKLLQVMAHATPIPRPLRSAV